MNGALLERLTEAARAQRVPLEVLFEVTHRCNLPCTHCYLPHHEDRGELSLDEIERLFDTLARSGTLFLTLTGGEVLARRDFLEILDAAANRRFVIKVLTNATLITDEVADRFAKAGVLEISVSLYGATAPVHDQVTEIPGSFDRTLAGIECLRSKGLHVILKTPMMTSNGVAAKSVHQLALERNMPCNFDLSISPKNNGDPGPLALQLSRGAMVEVMSDQPFADIFNVNAAQSAGPEPCSAGRSYCAIGPTGDILPCIMMPKVVGNVRRDDFASVWNDDPFLTQLRNVTFDDLHACRSCEVKGSCTRCPGLAMHRGQGMDGCDLSAKEIARARRDARLRVL